MSEAAAFFDVDGTIVASNIVRYGVGIRTQEMSPLGARLWTLGFLWRVPWLVALDTASREAFQRAFYRIYAGYELGEVERRAARLFEEHGKPRILPRAAERVAWHRGQGHRVVLVSGSIEPIVAPLARHLGVADVVAPRLEIRDGVTTGALEDRPVAGRRKAEEVAAFAVREGIELGDAWAYADSLDDVAMLESVGHPAAVNPGRKLERIARSRGWDVWRW